jgi:hypothetical protein
MERDKKKRNTGEKIIEAIRDFVKGGDSNTILLKKVFLDQINSINYESNARTQ